MLQATAGKYQKWSKTTNNNKHIQQNTQLIYLKYTQIQNIQLQNTQNATIKCTIHKNNTTNIQALIQNENTKKNY